MCQTKSAPHAIPDTPTQQLRESLLSYLSKRPALLHVYSPVQPCYPVHMGFTKQTAAAARSRLNGRKRAAFWRALGFPNLVKARAASITARARRRIEKTAADRDTPYLIDGRPRGF